MTDHKLEVKNVSKSFPGVKALVDVSIYIDKGEIISLVGENGLRYKLKRLSSTSLR